MKEVLFIRNNIEKWRTMEELIDNIDFEMPDRLADVYTELTADLAFAQTHYPRSRITVYLNNLASALHNEIYRNRRERWSRLLTFWTQEVPDVMWKERRLLLLSFVIFMASVLTGVVSTLGDSSFPRLILGDGYMDMTLENIAQCDHMAVGQPCRSRFLIACRGNRGHVARFSDFVIRRQAAGRFDDGGRHGCQYGCISWGIACANRNRRGIDDGGGGIAFGHHRFSRHDDPQCAGANRRWQPPQTDCAVGLVGRSVFDGGGRSGALADIPCRSAGRYRDCLIGRTVFYVFVYQAFEKPLMPKQAV